MVAMVGHNSKRRLKHEGDSHSSASMMAFEKSNSSYSSGMQENSISSNNGKSWGLFKRQNGKADNDSSPSVGYYGREDNERYEASESMNEGEVGSKTESAAQNPKVVETFPDSENEFHEVIRNQNWDLLEILLKEYDFKKYIKPKEQKKPARKLRVAKYLPDISWKKQMEVPQSPLYGLDALGRAPLHLCCVSPCPDKPLLRLLFCARDLATIPDATGSLPLHLAVTHEHSIDVIDKLIRGYHQGAMECDASGRTPLMWAIEMVRRRKEDEKEGVPTNHSYWAYPLNKEAASWQTKQTLLWQLVNFMLENRVVRRQKLQPLELRRITVMLGLAAPPKVVSIFLDLGRAALKNELIAGPSLTLCVSRQYPLNLLEKVIDLCPMDFAKEHKDGTGRGVVAMHYRIGCIAHQENVSDGNSKRESFRMIMQNLANAAGDLHVKFTPGKPYKSWWGKLKYLINLWGSHVFDDEEASHDSLDVDDLLLHNALSNPDVPPSLIRLLASLRPHALDLEHPKSTALPIHLACRLWRFKLFPPRKGEKEGQMDKVVLQLLEGDFSRTRKRYKNRLPVHHAIAAGHHWMFIKPLVVHDRATLRIRDPSTKLYPFQLAASYKATFDLESLARRKSTNTEWSAMNDHQKDHITRGVAHFYDLGQLSLIYELLRYDPTVVSHDSILEAEALRNLAKPKRMIVSQGLAASEEVALAAQIKMIRAMFGLGPVSAHFIAWAYENTRRGWKTHRSNFGVLKEAIMDGFITSAMDKWWRKLKFWIWSDCPWESPPIPRRDDFLLHGALCNSDTSPWIINLIVECFPRSASIPLPGSNGCYPLHIACVTKRYLPLPFEFANKKSVIGMIMKAYPDAALLKWENRLPLHLAIANAKEWDEISYLTEEEPVALAIADPEEGFFPFQLMALDRPYTVAQRERFEQLAEKTVGVRQWRAFSAHHKVAKMSEVLEQHEINTLGGVWQLLRRNPTLVSLSIDDQNNSISRSLLGHSSNGSSKGQKSSRVSSASKNDDFLKVSAQNLSMASIDFLEGLFEDDTKKTEARKARESSRSSISLEDSISDPFLGTSFRLPAREVEKPQSDPSKRNGESSKLSPNSESSSMVDPFSGSSARSPPIAYMREQRRTRDLRGSGSLRHSELSYNGSLRASAELSSRQFLSETSDLSLDGFEEFDESSRGMVIAELCRPRRKDILLIRNKRAFVVWRSTVLPPTSKKLSQNKIDWAVVLQELGEEVALGDMYTIRHEQEQRVISSAVVDGKIILIDEDDTYVWILCGEESISVVEKYDVEVAIIVTFSLLDELTGVWLESVLRARSKEFSASEDGGVDSILRWILSSAENPAGRSSNQPRYMIPHSVLRLAFAGDMPHESSSDIEQYLKRATIKLWYVVAKLRLEGELPRRKWIGVRYLMARRVQYERQRLKFNRDQKSVKFMKNLRKKQRRAKRSVEENESFVAHEGGFNDTTAATENGITASKGHIDRAIDRPPVAIPRLESKQESVDTSLAPSDLFEPARDPHPDKPLLAAATRVKAERELVAREGAKQASLILETMHQPNKMCEDDAASLHSTDLFEEPSIPRTKPLLAAAMKAKKENEGRSGLHLLNLSQPRPQTGIDDSHSLAPDDLFEPPRGAPPKQPLLAAALRAKQKAEEANHASRVRQRLLNPDAVQNCDKSPPKSRRRARRRLPAHLQRIHQPATIFEDDDVSLRSRDVFDPPRDPLPAKPLVSAALKAKAQNDNESRRRGQNPHLLVAHQPTAGFPDDDSSLAPTDVFDPPRPLPSHKTLLTAAILTKTRKDAQGSSNPEHLQHVHQPFVCNDDDVSLAPSAVFAPPAPPLPPKPLLAAALKAKDERDRGIVRTSSKPMQRTKSILRASSIVGRQQQTDNNNSLDMGDIFDSTPTQVHNSPSGRDVSTRDKVSPSPMRAQLVRQTSIERAFSRRLSSYEKNGSDDGSSSIESEASYMGLYADLEGSPEQKKKGPSLPKAAKLGTESVKSPPPEKPKRKRSGIMKILSRRKGGGQTS